MTKKFKNEKFSKKKQLVTKFYKEEILEDELISPAEQKALDNVFELFT